MAPGYADYVDCAVCCRSGLYTCHLAMLTMVIVWCVADLGLYIFIVCCVAGLGLYIFIVWCVARSGVVSAAPGYAVHVDCVMCCRSGVVHVIPSHAGHQPLQCGTQLEVVLSFVILHSHSALDYVSTMVEHGG